MPGQLGVVSPMKYTFTETAGDHCLPGRYHSRAPDTPDPSVPGDTSYQVWEVLDVRFHQRRWEYLIAWEGCGLEDNTWEPARNILDKELWKTFHQDNPGFAEVKERKLAAKTSDKQISVSVGAVQSEPVISGSEKQEQRSSCSSVTETQSKLEFESDEDVSDSQSSVLPAGQLIEGSFIKSIKMFLNETKGKHHVDAKITFPEFISDFCSAHFKQNIIDKFQNL
ncbi:chromobox protein homolog 5-like [Rhinatrema bivittatum]|uniref:chromobox protein homolog 5-like n=1 Tax=Rhinatrema bivittatum TaxID=194408 RepID=UPI0011279445|nr:chromobox protein homolog 5-like [Rhinatrema bivittatum]